MKDKFFFLLRKFPLLERNRRSSVFPRNTQVCLFNKRPVLHQDFTQKTLQDAIDELQRRLLAEGYLSELSGEFDSETEQAVRDFQKDNNLFIDGVVGPLTWACLLYPKLSFGIHKNATPEVKAAIRDLQKILRSENFSIEDTNGCFGRDTEKAVKIFQSRYGLRVDGVVGAISWAVLLGMRQKTTGGFPQGFYLLVPHSLSVCDQLLMVAFIVLGMYLNPISTVQTPPQFSVAIATAYALTYVVPVLLERIPFKPLSQSKLPLLKYAPFICVGMFWKSVLEVLQGLIEKILLAT